MDLRGNLDNHSPLQITGRLNPLRNEKLLFLVKDLPDNEMKKLIIANTAVGKNELQSLARERAVSVMNHLISKGGLPPEQLFQKNEDIYKAPEKDTISHGRVEFNAIAQ